MTELVATVENLQAKLRAHVGEFILIVENNETKTRGRGGCFGSDWDYRRKFKLTLGVIGPAARRFKFTSETRELPTSRFYVSDWGYDDGKVKQGAWPRRDWLGTPIAVLMALPMRYHSRDAETHPNDMYLMLVVGDEAVHEWFNPTEPVERVGVIFPERNCRVRYQREARAVGRPLQNAPELEAGEAAERESLLDGLWDLEAGLKRYANELAAIRKTSQTTGILARGGAVSVVENEDDVRVHSIGPSQELNRRLDQLRSRLQRADKLGLEEHPYVQAFRLRYGIN